MLITYRRTGGGLLLLMLAAAALVATVFTVVVGAVLLIGGVALGAVVLLARAVLPASRRRHTEPRGTPWPQETIEAKVVKARNSSGDRDRLRMNGDRGMIA
jgi:membrane protein implicated in regulation of membrane protease activity